MRSLNESLRMSDEIIDELTSGVIRESRSMVRRPLSSFSQEQLPALELLARFSPYHRRVGHYKSNLSSASEQMLFIKENLSSLTVEEQADFNELNIRSKVVMTEYIPIIVGGGFMGSLIYAIATQPTMKSVTMPVFKGTLVSVIAALAYYRYDRKNYAHQLNSCYETIIDRITRSRRRTAP